MEGVCVSARAPAEGARARRGGDLIEALEGRLEALEAVQTWLVLLVDRTGVSLTAAMEELARRRGLQVVNLGVELARDALAVPRTQRSLELPHRLRALAERQPAGGLLLLDRLEILFEGSLRLDPLDLLRRLARVRRVVAVWPGRVAGGRLTYAALGHPEHQDYSLEGLSVVEL